MNESWISEWLNEVYCTLPWGLRGFSVIQYNIRNVQCIEVYEIKNIFYIYLRKTIYLSFRLKLPWYNTTLKPALHYKIPRNIYKKKIKIVTKSIMSIQWLTGSRNFCNIICLRNAWRSPNVCVRFERENWPPSSKIMATESWYFTFSVFWLDKFVQQKIKQRHSHSLCETAVPSSETSNSSGCYSWRPGRQCDLS